MYKRQEKAGIIKEKTPVVIGETTPETKPILTTRAKEVFYPLKTPEAVCVTYEAGEVLVLSLIHI